MINVVHPLERLTFIFEHRRYPIREEHRDGYVTSDRGDRRYFTIINGVCTPEKVKEYFNPHGIGLRVLEHPLFEDSEPVSIEFYTNRCGF